MESDLILEKLNKLENIIKKNENKPLNFNEAATYLGFRPSYLYKLTHRKLIRFYKPSGKMLFFSKTELDEWIYSKARGSAKSRVDSDDLSIETLISDDEEEESEAAKQSSVKLQE